MRGGTTMDKIEFDENWHVCVPANKKEQDNIEALKDYLNSIYYC